MSGRVPVLRTITLGASYAPLSVVPLIGNFTITAIGSNSGPCYFLGDDASDVIVAVNNWFEFVGVDLAALQMKGTPGDKVTVIGHA